MIHGIYYQPIYLILVTVFSIVYYNKYTSSKKVVYDNKRLAIFLAILFSIFIGLRPPFDILSDTGGLVIYYQSVANDFFEFTWDTDNFVFDNLLWGMSAFGFDYSIWLTFVASIYFFGRYIAYKKIFPNNTNIAFLVFLGAFITYSSATNGFKAGAASSLFVCAVAYKDTLRVAIPFLFLAVGMHHAMLVCVIAYIIAYFYKKQKIYYCIWLISLLLAIAHVTYFQNLLGTISPDEKAGSYLSLDSHLDSVSWRGGMRYDFALYSAIPIIQSWWHRRRYNFISDRYTFILNLYMLLNSVWMLCMYANFTNRIAALSWALYPIVIMLPYVEKKEGIEVYGTYGSNKAISKVLLYNLLFTLFMEVVYYGLIKLNR